MQIVIPTRARTDRQLTLSFLPPESLKRTTLVCPKSEVGRLVRLRKEVELYKDVQIVGQPVSTWRIAPKREWICKEYLKAGHPKILMLDDDLTFSTRINPDDPNDKRLRPVWGEELIPEFGRIEEMLGEEFPHAGFGQRLFNHQKQPGWDTLGSRMIYALGYYLPIVVRECEFNRVQTHEDMDITLQLLRKGHANAVWNTTVVDQDEYDAFGGTSIERTVTSNDADVFKLAELHRGYVTVRIRTYETSVKRREPHVQWKKALEDGKRNK